MCHGQAFIANYKVPFPIQPSIVVPTAVIYGLILLVGLLGNVCTCLVILRNKSMQNPTNYYLFSLAVSDLLILTLGLPMELYGVFDVTYPYKFGEFICKGRAFLIEFTSYASILTITCFSVERWLAIWSVRAIACTFKSHGMGRAPLSHAIGKFEPPRD